MPVYTYAPQWDILKIWWRRFESLLPSDYTGLVGVRLHRTGHPLTFELFGKGYPDKQLYPVLTLIVKAGRLVRDWERIEHDFDVPWVKPEDFHALRENVMEFYHAEDLLEPRAEAILKGEATDEETLRKAFVDHTGNYSRTLVNA